MGTTGFVRTFVFERRIERIARSLLLCASALVRANPAVAPDIGTDVLFSRAMEFKIVLVTTEK